MAPAHVSSSATSQGRARQGCEDAQCRGPVEMGIERCVMAAINFRTVLAEKVSMRRLSGDPGHLCIQVLAYDDGRGYFIHFLPETAR